jgi:hypothetical protein
MQDLGESIQKKRKDCPDGRRLEYPTPGRFVWLSKERGYQKRVLHEYQNKGDRNE